MKCECGSQDFYPNHSKCKRCYNIATMQRRATQAKGEGFRTYYELLKQFKNGK